MVTILLLWLTPVEMVLSGSAWLAKQNATEVRKNLPPPEGENGYSKMVF